MDFEKILTAIEVYITKVIGQIILHLKKLIYFNFFVHKNHFCLNSTFIEVNVKITGQILLEPLMKILIPGRIFIKKYIKKKKQENIKILTPQRSSSPK